MRTLLAFAVSMLVVSCALFAGAAFVAMSAMPTAPVAVASPACVEIERPATINFHPELEATIAKLRVENENLRSANQRAAGAATSTPPAAPNAPAAPRCERCAHAADDFAAKPVAKPVAKPCSCSLPQPKRDRVIFNFNR